MRPSFGIAIITTAYGTFAGIYGGWLISVPFYTSAIMLVVSSILDRDYWRKRIQ